MEDHYNVSIVIKEIKRQVVTGSRGNPERGDLEVSDAFSVNVNGATLPEAIKRASRQLVAFAEAISESGK